MIQRVCLKYLFCNLKTMHDSFHKDIASLCMCISICSSRHCGLLLCVYIFVVPDTVECYCVFIFVLPDTVDCYCAFIFVVPDTVDCYCKSYETPGKLCPVGFTPMRTCRGWQLVFCCNQQDLIEKVSISIAMTFY